MANEQQMAVLAEMCREFHDGDRWLLGIIQDYCQEINVGCQTKWEGEVGDWRDGGRLAVKYNPLLAVSFLNKSPYEHSEQFGFYTPLPGFYDRWSNQGVVRPDELPDWFFLGEGKTGWSFLESEKLALDFLSEVGLRFALGRPFETPDAALEEFLASLQNG